MLGAEELAELARWHVPGRLGRETTTISVREGHTLVFVGPNGSGKSALSHWLHLNRAEALVVRVLAHRRLWLSSAGTEMTASNRATIDASFAHYDSQSESRTTDGLDGQRSSRLLFDLLGRVNGRNARVAALVDENGDLANVEESILAKIEAVFTAADLNLAFTITDHLTFNAQRNGREYPISEMSDGEKGAFLLAADVLLAPKACVQIIDEPERHLHRSISAQLVAALARARPDCAFIFLTHDLDLASRLDSESTSVYVMGGVDWQGQAAVGWDLRAEPIRAALPDSVRRAILGGRDRLLFVEGDVSSLDSSLFSLLFPDWTVVPCGGADEVRRAVHGLSTISEYHWVHGQGVLDGDARTANEVAMQSDARILILPVNEVESLYYLDWIVEAVAARQAKSLGRDGATMTTAAKMNAIAALRGDEQRQHLAAANAEKIMRRQVLAELPTREDLKSGATRISIEIASEYPNQMEKLHDAIRSESYGQIIRDFSVRDSGLLKAVAESLYFRNRTDYESAVRVFLTENPAGLERLRSLVGQLTG